MDTVASEGPRAPAVKQAAHHSSLTRGSACSPCVTEPEVLLRLESGRGSIFGRRWIFLSFVAGSYLADNLVGFCASCAQGKGRGGGDVVGGRGERVLELRMLYQKKVMMEQVPAGHMPSVRGCRPVPAHRAASVHASQEPSTEGRATSNSARAMDGTGPDRSEPEAQTLSPTRWC